MEELTEIGETLRNRGDFVPLSFSIYTKVIIFLLYCKMVITNCGVLQDLRRSEMDELEAIEAKEFV